MRMGLQYRAAALSGLVAQVVFGLIFIMIFEALFASNPHAQPMTFDEVVVYIWLGAVQYCNWLPAVCN
jgi:ABC-2 type transport system permease protein